MVWENHLQHPFQLWYSILNPVLELLEASIPAFLFFLFCTGKKLSDLERVTSLKVYNWFANRRKEIKRRANIGNVSDSLEELLKKDGT